MKVYERLSPELPTTNGVCPIPHFPLNFVIYMIMKNPLYGPSCSGVEVLSGEAFVSAKYANGVTLRDSNRLKCNGLTK